MPFLQIEYHELETFNGDSSSVVVEEQSFSMEQLQPGRNYSLAVKAVSNGIESLERRIYQATRECSTVVQSVQRRTCTTLFARIQ